MKTERHTGVEMNEGWKMLKVSDEIVVTEGKREQKGILSFQNKKILCPGRISFVYFCSFRELNKTKQEMNVN